MSRVRLFLLVLFAALIISTPVFTDRPFSTRGEPREALVAQSIVKSGDWILPQGYGGAVPSKPPMLHWAIAGLASVTGQFSDLICRLPSVIAAFVFALYLFIFLAPRIGGEVASGATLVLLTSVEWYRAAGACRVDMLLAVFLAAALLKLFEWEEKAFRGYPVVALLCLVAATLAKGPVGLVLPGAIFVTHSLLQGRKFRELVPAVLKLWVPVTLSAVIWYVCAYLEGGQAFSARVYYENVARFASSMEDEPHAHSALYLYATVLLGLMPWTLLIVPLALPSIRKIREVRGFFRHPITSLRSLQKFDAYSVVVVLAFLVFFSIPSSKRSVYLLPCYPFLCLLVARYFESVLKHVGERLRRISLIICAAVFGLWAVLVLLIARSSLLDPRVLELFSKTREFPFYAELISAPLENFGWQAALLCLPLGVAALACASLSRRAIRWTQVFHVSLVFMFTIVVLDAVFLSRMARSLTPREFAAEVSRVLPVDAALYSFRSEAYALSFYLSRVIKRAEDEEPLPGSFIFLYEHDIEELKKERPQQHYEIVKTSAAGIVKALQRLVLVRITS